MLLAQIVGLPRSYLSNRFGTKECIQIRLLEYLPELHMKLCYNLSVWLLIGALDQREHVVHTRVKQLDVILETVLRNFVHRIRP
jgi:hypothetical protein